MANTQSLNPRDILLQFVQGDEGKAWALGRTGWTYRTQDSGKRSSSIWVKLTVYVILEPFLSLPISHNRHFQQFVNGMESLVMKVNR